MDPELRAYLEEQRTTLQDLRGDFRELRSDFQELKSDLQEQKEQFQEQKNQLQEQGNQLQEQKLQLQELRTYVEERFQKVEDSDRHTRILVEGLRGDFRLLAEGFVGFQESWQADKAELLREIGDVKSLVRQSYSDHNRRVTELESWRERRDRDPFAVIRGWLGKTR
jgi:chromosome segregation ATPase